MNITIADLDDQDPLFNNSTYRAVVEEDIYTGSINVEPAPIFAVDQDTLDDEISYEFVGK